MTTKNSDPSKQADREYFKHVAAITNEVTLLRLELITLAERIGEDDPRVVFTAANIRSYAMKLEKIVKRFKEARDRAAQQGRSSKGRPNDNENGGDRANQDRKP